MFPAAIPLISLGIQMLPSIMGEVKKVEDAFQAFHGGEKTGPAKLVAATDGIMTLLSQLARVPGANPAVPDVSVVTKDVNAVVDWMNQAGVLKGNPLNIAQLSNPSAKLVSAAWAVVKATVDPILV